MTTTETIRAIAVNIVDSYKGATLECDCGSGDVYIGTDMTRDENIDQLVRLINHAKYDHITPRDILRVQLTTIVDTSNIA